jgi:SAM-dependent methyltransferase
MQFVTHPIGALIFPSYILRSALYRGVKKFSEEVSGDVLDFGCGSKPYESVFNNAKKYIGIDVEVSGHNHQNSKVDVYFDGVHIPFEDCSFDSVVCFDVMEHVPDLRGTLQEIGRVIKPNGTFLASMPFAFPEHEIPYDFRRLTRYGLHRNLSENGFTDIELVETTTSFLSIQQLFLAYITDDVIKSKSIPVRIIIIPMVSLFNVMSFILNFIFPKCYNFPLSFVVRARAGPQLQPEGQ